MTCPKCNAAMEKVVFEGIEVDRCTGCRGLWFDALEHEKLKEIGGASAIDDGVKPADAAEPHKIQCPVCHTPMIAMSVLGNSSIKYESCTVCYGAFFDAGEFREFRGDAMVARLKGVV